MLQHDQMYPNTALVTLKQRWGVTGKKGMYFVKLGTPSIVYDGRSF